MKLWTQIPKKNWKYWRSLNGWYILSKHCQDTFSLQWIWTYGEISSHLNKLKIHPRYHEHLIMWIWFHREKVDNFSKNCPFLTCHVIFMFMFCDFDDFDNVNVVALVMQIIFEAGIMMTIKITIQCWTDDDAIYNDDDDDDDKKNNTTLEGWCWQVRPRTNPPTALIVTLAHHHLATPLHSVTVNTVHTLYSL